MNAVKLYLSIFAVSCFCLAGQAGAQQAPKRIWCLGDSITLGTYVDADNDGTPEPYPTYRYPLYKQLQAVGYDFDFVGTQTGFDATWSPATCLATYPDWPDQQHDGWSGYTSQRLLNGYGGFAGVDDEVANMNPDIVLLHVGTNDQYLGMTLPQSQQAIAGILSTIRATKPNCEFYVAAIIPTAGSNPWHTPIDTLSAWIRDNIESYSTDASPVHMVDMHTGYDNVNWYVPRYGGGNDGVHPNHDGEQFMADRWFAAMTPEPATLSLLSVGVLSLLRRRKR